MSNKKEKETGTAKKFGNGGLGLNANTDAGITGRLARLVRSSDTTAKKSSADKSKRPEESSLAATKTAKGVVSENQPRKVKPVSDSVSKPRASAAVLKETVTKSASMSSNPASVSSKPASLSSKSASVSSAVKHTAAKVAQKETGGQKEKDQMARTPRVRKQPDSLANMTGTKNTTPQQVWKVKAQPEVSAKEVSAKKQKGQTSGITSKQPTKTTKSSPPAESSKPKKSATQSKDKQVQGKKTGHKASTSKSYLDTEIHPSYHIEFNVADLEEFDYQIRVCCCLCERDLRVAPVEGHTEHEYSALPVAAILPCGHTFHNDCLSYGELEGQQAEPPCVFCESF